MAGMGLLPYLVSTMPLGTVARNVQLRRYGVRGLPNIRSRMKIKLQAIPQRLAAIA
jgi:hypothetical protein